MKPIPEKLKRELASDPYYKKCCITGIEQRDIEWHHNLIFGGSQVNEKFCILPLGKQIHKDIHKHKEKCDWIMLSRATDEELERYSKAINYKYLRDMLIRKYGTYNP